jgi:hypothetical protein
MYETYISAKKLKNLKIIPEHTNAGSRNAATQRSKNATTPKMP